MTRRLHVAAVQLMLAAASLLSTLPAAADVTTKHSIAVQGVGFMAAANMSGTSTRTIAGDRSRNDDDVQLKSKIVRMLAHGAVGPTAQIVRLDTGKIYELNINKKQYTEVSFEEMREHLNKALNQPAEQSQQKTPAPMDDSQCEWLDPTAEAKKTGEKAQIAGYAAERMTITVIQPCKDKKTGSICEVALGLEEWLAPGFAISAEEQKFDRAYIQKLGIDSGSMQDAAKRAQKLFSRYKGLWTQLAAKMKDAKGYPVKTSFTFALGGAQCSSQQSANSDSDSSSPSDLTGQIGSKLGSLFHHKSDEEAAPTTPALPPPIPPGTLAIVTVSSELLSVSTDAAPAGTFDVPADFKKVEEPAPKSTS